VLLLWLRSGGGGEEDEDCDGRAPRRPGRSF